MLAYPIQEQEYKGTNLEAFTVYLYKDFFLIAASKELTGITSKIRINKHSKNITQLDQDEPVPDNPENQITCSGFMGILPIYSRHFLLLIQLVKNVCKIEEHTIYEVEKVIFLPFELPLVAGTAEEAAVIETQNDQVSHILMYLKTFLLPEGYYFGFRYDLSLSRSAYAAGFISKNKFYWNYSIGKHFSKLEDSRWFVGVIQGSIRSFKMAIDGNIIKYILITRRSWAKGGTRFNARGIDLKGNVANFCQTEQLMYVKGQCFSHVQIRGSVPAFWKQTGLNQTVVMDPDEGRNKQSFKKHIQKLITHYQRVICVNLLCLDRKGEDELTYYYQKLVKENRYKEMKYEYFDVHCASKGQKFQRCNFLITQKLQGVAKYFGYYQEDVEKQIVVAAQNGVVRVNCLDNLDRTNLIQSKMAYHMLTAMLEKVGIDVKKVVDSPSVLIATNSIDNSSMFVIHLKNAWADNGDMLSKHYTGTGSTHTNITRTGKRDIKGMLDHGFKSCMRLYQHFVDDSQKQEAINILLCQHTETANLEEIKDRLKKLQHGKTEEEILEMDTW